MRTDNKNIILNQKGVSLYIIVFILFLVLTLASAGVYFFGTRIVRVKQTTTINTLESAVNSIISWSQANGRIPDSLGGTTDFTKALKNTKDAYGQTLFYMYDNDLTSLPTPGLCGKNSAYITVNFCSVYPGCSPTTTISNVAFMVLSKGYNHVIQTKYDTTGLDVTTGNVATATTIDIYSPTLTINNQPYDDIVRIVTLNELQSRAGCAGVTGGRLMILNNELPRACSSNAYAAIVYPYGGVPPYNWCISGNLPSGVISSIITCPYTGATLSFTGSPQGITGGYPITVTLTDSAPSPATVQRTYVINVFNCKSGSGGGWNLFGGNWNPFGTMMPGFSTNTQPPTGPPPPTGALGGGGQGGINTGPPGGGGGGTPNNQDSQTLASNIVTSSGGTTGLAIQNNVIKFGFDTSHGAACVWYPYNFPLLGKTMRAFWNFCFNDIDTYLTTSTQFADGYTFALMQSNNPTSYCGTGTSDASQTPYDCQYGGALGEFLSYCGLPGNNMALEFDIYPNGGRNDPIGNYNHVAVVQSLSTHSGPTHTGTYGDNTHNVWGNPACDTTYCNPACNGTCTGTGATCTGFCNGASVTSQACTGTCYGTCNNGTCSGSGLGCAFGTVCGNSHAVTWMEQEGCSSSYDNHNARVEIHTRCNSNCSSCETSSCTSKALLKAWIDKGPGGKGNNDLTVNDTSTPDISYCFTLPSSMLNQVKVGFTEGTGDMNQYGYIANFIANFFGSCSQPTIMATSLPRIQSGQSYTATFSASGGTPPYKNWSWSAANLTNTSGTWSTSTTLPPSCNASSMSSNSNGTGTISCPNMAAAPTGGYNYNTVLVSASDSCTADGCDNTVSMNLSPRCCITANPSRVASGSTTQLTWAMAATNASPCSLGSITNIPVTGSWSTTSPYVAPGGTCTNANINAYSNCTTGSIASKNTYLMTADNDFGTGNCSVTVCPSMYITPGALSPGAVNSLYSAAIAANGGVSPFSWSASSLPSWLSLQTTGSCGSNSCSSSSPCLCGTPATAGTFTPTITLADSCGDGATVSQTYTLNVCSYSINPTSALVGPGSGTGSTSVTASAGCGWTAISNNSWITITSGSGTGIGTVNYSYTTNNTGSARIGTITIAGQTFTLTQAAAPSCSFTGTPYTVYSGYPATFTWTITNGPLTGESFSTSPGGNCGNLSNSATSCTTGNLTGTHNLTYPLTVTNANGQNTCSITCTYYHIGGFYYGFSCQ